MAIPKTTIKTPGNDVVPAPSNAPNRKGPGVFNGEPGYKGRTMGPNSVPEKTYDAPAPANNVTVRSPSIPASGK